jgi:hypothetical protein
MFESSGANTDWSNAAAWIILSGSDADGIPDLTDSVTVLDGDTIIISANANCEYLELQSSGGNSVFTVNAGTTLEVLGDWRHIAGANNASIDVNIYGAVNVSGIYYVHSDTGYTNYDHDMLIAVGGAVNVGAPITSRIEIGGHSSASSMIIDGVFDCEGPFDVYLYSSSQIVIDIEGEMEIERDLYLNPVGPSASLTIKIDGGTLDCDAKLYFKASLCPASALVVDMKYPGARLELKTEIVMASNGGTISADASPSTVAYDGDHQTVRVDNRISYNSIEIGGTGTKTLEDDLSSIYMFGNMTINNGGTFNTGGALCDIPLDLAINGAMNTSGEMDVDGDFTIGPAGVMAADAPLTMYIEGDWTNNGTYTYHSGDNIIFDGASLSTITGATTWYELTLDNSSGLIVASGAQNIEGILDIDEGQFNANGQSVSLVSNAAGTAQMDDIGTGSYLGDLEVERYMSITGQGWREITSPVEGTALSSWQTNGIFFSGFTGSDDPGFSFMSAYRYNDTLANGSPSNGYIAAADIADTTGPTTGWKVYIDNGVQKLDVVGTPIQGDFLINLDYEDDAGTPDAEGWNLVGNPFACTIDWDAIDNADMINMDDAYWVWIVDGVATPQYGLYVGGDGTGTNGTTQYMPHSQAFWVHATADNPSLRIREADKNVTDQAFYKSGAVTADNMIKVSAYNSSAKLCDQAILRMKTGASNGFVVGEDYAKLWTSPALAEQTTSLMFMAGAKEIAYNAVSRGTQDVFLKSYAGASFTGPITLKFENIENYDGNACITLEDLHTGTIQDLRQNPQYTYSKNLMAPAVRFVIHITEEVNSINATGISCHGTNDGLIEIEGIASNGYAVTWTDQMGNLIGTGFDSSSDFDISGLAAGNYLVTLSTGCVLPPFEVEVMNAAPIMVDFVLSNPTLDLALGELPILTNTSVGPYLYTWDMGDGNGYIGDAPLHNYSATGVYQIELKAQNKQGCEESKYTQVTVVNSAITTGVIGNKVEAQANVYATANEIIISTDFTENRNAIVSVLTVEGKLIFDQQTMLGETTVKVPKPDVNGMYLVTIQLDNSTRLVYKIK